MKQRNKCVIGRCFGTSVLGPRGQLVIPAEARKELDIDTGDKLLVFGHFGGRGLVFIKAEAAEELMISSAAGLMRWPSWSRKVKSLMLGYKMKAR